MTHSDAKARSQATVPQIFTPRDQGGWHRFLYGAVQLIDQEAIAAREVFGDCANLVSKVDGALIDEQLLELESHLLLQTLQEKRVESRAVNRVEKRK